VTGAAVGCANVVAVSVDAGPVASTARAVGTDAVDGAGVDAWPPGPAHADAKRTRATALKRKMHSKMLHGNEVFVSVGPSIKCDELGS
jgi:hypothetical protein